METYTTLEDYEARPCAVTVGMFDGLHAGHRDLLCRLVGEARRRGLEAVVVTFWPHPRKVLSKGNDTVGLLTTVEERRAGLEALGVDRLVELQFTRELSDVPARDFVRRWLVGALGARYLLLGYNHRFGSDDLEPEAYVRMAVEEGLEAERHGAFTMPGGGKVSSSEVRSALLRGDVGLAASLLGRPYSIEGEVVHGDGLGRRLGSPTANVSPSCSEKVVPREGVYACLVSLDDGELQEAVVNVGVRPTVGGGPMRIEANLLNFSGDAYGRRARVEFVGWLREERRFDGTEALAAQIAADREAARAVLGARGGGSLPKDFD